jgi:predicted AlkP superfamily pyrophosphatase or phosphodiesterase
MLRPTLLLSLFVCGLVPTSVQAGAKVPERKVLMIGIDGCRPDALEKADTPALDRLVKSGVRSRNTSILGPRKTTSDTISGPGWSSIYTGVWADKHGVNDNTFEGRNYEHYPHFFSRLRESRPDAVTGSFCTWQPIADNIVSGATVSQCLIKNDDGSDDWVQGDARVADTAAKFLAEGDPVAACAYFGQVDETGHAKGFHPTVPEYVAAIERVDGHVQQLLDAIESRPHADSEEWLVVVTTDHGGQGTGHGDGHETEEIRRVFLIVSGPGVTDPGPARQTYLVDAVPTALTWLGVKLDPAWELDGTPFGVAAPVQQDRP